MHKEIQSQGSRSQPTRFRKRGHRQGRKRSPRINICYLLRLRLMYSYFFFRYEKGQGQKVEAGLPVVVKEDDGKGGKVVRALIFIYLFIYQPFTYLYLYLINTSFEQTRRKLRQRKWKLVYPLWLRKTTVKEEK